MIRSNVVEVITKLWAGGSGDRKLVGAKDFPFSKTPKPALGHNTQHANYFPSSSAEVKKEWSYTSTPLKRLHYLEGTISIVRNLFFKIHQDIDS